ncbi:hypothetical protein [Helicobacter salomonis]|uniref:hypothetical protein n=1 Tax=Helicobacter salomonis TaxID=56878 RepID=UPI000CF107E0|nr:hypothetical protein [Helicobacter salomonis]
MTEQVIDSVGMSMAQMHDADLEMRDVVREAAYSACVYEGKIALVAEGENSAHFVSHKPLEGQSKEGFHFRQGGIHWAQQMLSYNHALVIVRFKGEQVEARLIPTNTALTDL